MKKIALILIVMLSIVALAGCNNSGEDPEPLPEVVLTVAGAWTDCRAIDEIGRFFKAKYPNCTIVYENVQNYYETITKRMTGDSAIDLFFTSNIQADSSDLAPYLAELLPHVLNCYDCEGLDLSETYQPLLDNFIYREENATSPKLYAIPVGSEMRGLYVNKTLLDSLSIDIPTNQAELLQACAILKSNGYIPFQGNPGRFATLLMYPWIANTIANAENYNEVYNQVENREAGVSELFREPFEFLHLLTEEYYYDYKTAQELGFFNQDTDEVSAQHFFNIVSSEDGLVKEEGVGQIAFMPNALSIQNLMQKTKEDYHSDIEYVFIPAPIGEDGGYVYLSPGSGIAANKDSVNVEWSIKFLDFLFETANNKIFNEYFNTMPNTKDVFSYISTQFDVPTTNISHLGQVTFSYNFYYTMQKTLVNLCKCNNPKYMVTVVVGEEDDPNDSIPDDDYLALKTTQFYLDELESALVQ